MICPHCGKAISKLVSSEDKKQIIKFYREGFSLRDISAKLGNRVSYSQAGRIIHEAARKALEGEG